MFQLTPPPPVLIDINSCFDGIDGRLKKKLF